MIVATNASGQLCNRLLFLAHTYATGLATNQKVIHMVAKDLQSQICLEGDDLSIFPYDTRGAHTVYEKIMGKLFGEGFRARSKNCITEQRNSLYSSGGHHVVNNWYYRDYPAFFAHKEQIKPAFSPVEPYQTNVEEFSRRMRAEYPDHLLVGVHIRRGDYKTWRKGAFFFADEQFAKWMKELQETTDKKLVFLVFSNEKITFENYAAVGAPVVSGPGHPIEDLYVMAKCDYIFGPPSTYSWWAAFYGEKPYLTLYSKNQKMDMKDFALVEGEEFDPDKFTDLM